MKLKKLFILPICGLLLLSINVSTVENVVSASENEVSKTLQSIKYANSSNEVSNLYSSSVEYDDFVNSGLVYVSDPNIQAIVYYGSKKFELANYSIANVNTRPDGESRNDYVATYVYKYPASTVKTYSATINNGNLDSISCSFETTNSINIDVSIETEVGTGGSIYGVEAKAGIRKFFNDAAGFGSGNAFTLEYDLYEDALTLNSSYSIKKTTHYYEFITVVYVSDYSKYWSWFSWKYKWEDYSYYAYLTNSIILDTYTLVEA